MDNIDTPYVTKYNNTFWHNSKRKAVIHCMLTVTNTSKPNHGELW
jgi:hypothetical protein